MLRITYDFFSDYLTYDKWQGFVKIYFPIELIQFGYEMQEARIDLDSFAYKAISYLFRVLLQLFLNSRVYSAPIRIFVIRAVRWSWSYCFRGEIDSRP